MHRISHWQVAQSSTLIARPKQSRTVLRSSLLSVAKDPRDERAARNPRASTGYHCEHSTRRRTGPCSNVLPCSSSLSLSRSRSSPALRPWIPTTPRASRNGPPSPSSSAPWSTIFPPAPPCLLRRMCSAITSARPSNSLTTPMSCAITTPSPRTRRRVKVHPHRQDRRRPRLRHRLRRL